MINLFDATVLAKTKLRTHKVRTGVAVGISGLLFGLIVLVIVLTQGVFDSVNRYSEVGLNNRSVLGITSIPQNGGFNLYEYSSNEDFIKDVEVAHADLVAKKQAAAKKYSIGYTPEFEDPSPVGIDPETNKRVITESGFSDPSTQAVAKVWRTAETKQFNIDEYVKKYPTATLRGTFNEIRPSDGDLTMMLNGVEGQFQDPTVQSSFSEGNSNPALTMLDGSLSKPFLTGGAQFDPEKGEVPVIIPHLAAEKLLGLKALDKEASPEQQRERLRFVRANIHKATASYCYRNQASSALLSEAIAQDEARTKATSAKPYIKPALEYAVPDSSSCGEVVVISDTRTAAEKKSDENRVLYEKEIGAWIGEPMQQKVVVRGVGVSSDSNTSMTTASISSFIKNLLGSSLGYGTWSIPFDLFAQLPEAVRNPAIFEADPASDAFVSFTTYLVEFDSKAEARTVLEDTGMFSGTGSNDVYANPFGSGVLFIDEARTWVEKILFWALIIIGGIAIIIMAGIIGRTISDSRRESAIFRAIGATRLDIGRIYGIYALLLSWRVVVFALVLGIGIALAIDLLFTSEATLGAQLAYAAVDTNIQFHLFSILTWYIPIIIGVIILVGLIASIAPIINGARRNPIKDMRDEG